MGTFIKSIKELEEKLIKIYPDDTFSSQEILDSLKISLQKELKKKGIFAGITVAWSESSGLKPSNLCFILTSEEFNTTPVIFESINLETHSGYICAAEDGNSVEFIISIHARYKHFDYGTNGCSLFSLRGSVLPDRVKNLSAFL